MKDFNGKRVLVTGGAKGVGKAVAERFGQCGALVIINYFHSHDRAKETRKELEKQGIIVHLIRASVARKDQVERMFTEIKEKFGSIDILVNNAADGALVASDEITEEQIDRAINTNLKGSLWCARHAAALMKEHGGGVIVNVSSLGAERPLDNYLAVGPTKAALESLTRYLAAEYGPYNIRVNTASAGLLDTDVIRHFPNYEQMCDDWRKATPLGRLGRADDLADVVLFLASDQARWITGQTILADGGISLSGVPKSYSSKDPPFFFKQSTIKKISVSNTQNNPHAIAIVGMGLIVSGASSPEEFWNILLEGPELVSATPEHRWNWRHFVSDDPTIPDKNYSQYGLYIINEPVAEEFCTDYSVTWLKHAVRQAVDGVTLPAAARCSCLFGYTADGSQALEESFVLRQYLRQLTDCITRNVPPEEAAGLIKETTRILSLHYFRGTQPLHTFLPHRAVRSAIQDILPEETRAMVVDTACSSSLYAAALGIQMLWDNTYDAVICGGVMTLGPLNGMLFSQLKGLSHSGNIRSLDQAADGVLFGDGAGVVVLKRLSQARHDGDTILGIIDACGGSSDGKGKAVSAPNTTGQRMALQRTWKQHPAAAENVEWILAHATGTPVGDRSELQALNALPGNNSPVYLSANKPLIGHTAWAAGAVSIIQAVLGLQHGSIPPQHRFSALPKTEGFDAQRFIVPCTEIPWPPRENNPRTAAVSGFGFGGTNAHLLISDRPVSRKSEAVPQEEKDPIAMVGWSACLPGLTTQAQISEWLKGTGADPGKTFTPDYAMQAASRFRIPPRTLRTVDVTQVLALECAQELKDSMGNTWDSLKDTTGVFFGHMGKTGHSILYGSRCYLDDACAALRTAVDFSSHPESERILEEFKKGIKASVPTSNENSFPGVMPNIIPARMANYFDLKGPTMVLDTGFTSAFTAHEIACRYLHSREISCAVVGGGNGTSIPEIEDMLNTIGPQSGLIPGEGLFLYAVMRERDAVEQGIPVLCIINDACNIMPETPTDKNRKSCGYGQQPERAYNYLGGEGTLGILQALHTGRAQVQVVCSCEDRSRNKNINLTRITQTRRSTAPAACSGPPVIVEEEPVCQVQRQTVELLPLPRETVGRKTAFILPNTVIIADSPETTVCLGKLAENCIVIFPGENTDIPGQGTGIRKITPEAVSAVLESQAQGYCHLRIIADLEESTDSSDMQEKYTAVHDLIFLTVQHMYETMRDTEGTCIGAFTRAIDNGIPRPITGLFAGLMNGLGCELGPACACLALFSDESDPVTAVMQAEEESTLRRILPSVVIDKGTRKTWLPRERKPNETVDYTTILDSNSIVVVTGGGRGLTAEITKALARLIHPKIYILGSTDIAVYPPEIFEGTDAEFEAGRPAFIRARSAQLPNRTVKDILDEFYRQWKARQTYRTICELHDICGSDCVTYFPCDILNSETVVKTIQTILQHVGHIDLLINGAGVDRSQSLPMKQFDDFQYVRDLKYRGYLNLKSALKRSPPRMWCNFGSMVSTLVFIPGQPDYLSGNMFLNTAACYAAARREDEFTIGWTLWNDTGMITAPYNKSVAQVVHDAALLTETTSAEGITLFMHELFQDKHTPVVTYMGETEKRKGGEAYNAADPFTHALYPQLIPLAAATKIAARVELGFYLDRILEKSENTILFERVFDLEKDAYLNNHVVNGYPTLPGTFVPEIAAEAARVMLPGMVVTSLENVTFKHYLRVYNSEKPVTVRIEATLKEKTENSARVFVRILSDVISPKGILLKRDREHFSLDVQLGVLCPDMPEAEQLIDGEPATAADPYHAPESPVLLTGMFVSTAGTSCTASGKYGRYTAPIPSGHPVFGSFLLPVFLLDGLARILALTSGKYQPVLAPEYIQKIEIFSSENDACLAEKQRRVDLHAHGFGESLEQPFSENSVCEAVDEFGNVLLRITGLIGIAAGFINSETGKLLLPGQVLKEYMPSQPGGEQLDANNTLEHIARQYETSVRSGAQQEHAKTFNEHISRLTGTLLDARRSGIYFYEQEISEYHGAWITCEGRRQLMLASYSYLDLLGHPAITAAATEALQRYGAGTHGARLLAGTTSLHHELERTIARFKHAENAIVYSSGYLTNLATIDALVGEGDWVVSDMLNHSSIVDGARFSRARFVQYGHNNMQSLEQRLIHCGTGRKLVIADAVFSMDGDIADLPNLIAICQKHTALLMIDEAHSTGVLGNTGHGIFEHFGIESAENVLKMGTLSKAIASVGGYVAGSKELIFALKNHARGFVFSAALPPPQTAAAQAAFDILEHEPERVARLQHNARLMREGLADRGFNILNSVTPVVPVVCGTIVKTIQMTQACKKAGLFVIPVMFPAVPLESPRLRVTVTAAHCAEDIQFALDVFERAGREAGIVSSQSKTIVVPDIQSRKPR